MKAFTLASSGIINNGVVIAVIDVDSIVIYTVVGAIIAKIEAIGDISLLEILHNKLVLVSNNTLYSYSYQPDFENILSFELHSSLINHPANVLKTNNKFIFSTTNANPNIIYQHDIDTLEVVKTLDLDVLNFIPIFAVSQRLVAFSTPNIPDKNVEKTSAILYNGVKSITEYGYSKISTYLNPTDQEVEINVNNQNISNGNPHGFVIIKDYLNSEVIAHFKAHSNQVSSIEFNPNQTLLITASIKGNEFYVWEVPGTVKYFENPPSSVVCLFRLERGYTPALIKELKWSFDSKFILASTARHTRHIYKIDPIKCSRKSVKIDKSDDSRRNHSPIVVNSISRIHQSSNQKKDSNKFNPISIFSPDSSNIIHTFTNYTISTYKIEYETPSPTPNGSDNSNGSSKLLGTSPKSPNNQLSSSRSPLSTSPMNKFMDQIQNATLTLGLPGGKNGVREIFEVDVNSLKKKKAPAFMKKKSFFHNSNNAVKNDVWDSKSWMANVEISTYNTIQFGPPIWLKPNVKFQVFETPPQNHEIPGSEILFQTQPPQPIIMSTVNNKKKHKKREGSRSRSPVRIGNLAMIEDGVADYSDLGLYVRDLDIVSTIPVPWSNGTRNRRDEVEYQYELSVAFEEQMEKRPIVSMSSLGEDVILSFDDAFHIELDEENGNEEKEEKDDKL